MSAEGKTVPPPYIIPGKPWHATFSRHQHQTGWWTFFFYFLFSLPLLLQLKVKRMMASRFTTSTARSTLRIAPATSHQVNISKPLLHCTLNILKMLRLPLLFSPPPPPSVYTSGGGNLNAALDDGKRKFVSYDTALGRSPGMTTCTSCQQQVMTNVTYKAGMYAWLMCLLFICCGWARGSGTFLGPYRRPYTIYIFVTSELSTGTRRPAHADPRQSDRQ